MDSYDPFILVLSGQSDLRRTMEFAVMEPFNQRIAIRYHMPGLSPEKPNTMSPITSSWPAQRSPSSMNTPSMPFIRSLSASQEKSAPSPKPPSPMPCSTKNAPSPPKWSSRSKASKDRPPPAGPASHPAALRPADTLIRNRYEQDALYPD